MYKYLIMERKEFLKQALTLAGIAFIPVVIAESCSKSKDTDPGGVNFTLDLNNAANAPLNNVGGSVVSNGVIVIRTGSATFSAFSSTCTHQGCTVGYDAAGSKIACPCHGGTYDPATGAVTGGPPPKGLAKYNATLSGNTLTVTS